VVLSIPLDEKTASFSVNRGVPFFMENKTLPISKSIQMLADRVVDMFVKQEEPAEVKKTLRR